MAFNKDIFPKLTNDELDDIVSLTDHISRFVNSHSEEAISVLGRGLCNDHRTLVQSKGRMIRGFLQQLQGLYKDGFYDARNEAICKWADEVLTKVDGPNLPFV